MKSSTIVWIVVILIVLGGAWYFLAQSPAPAAGPSTTMGLNGSPDQGNLGGTTTGSVQQPGDGTSISQNLVLGVYNNATLGEFLTAYDGKTLYTYSKDSAGVSNCSGTCATNWPPYSVPEGTTINLPSSSTGITGKISTIKRADGSVQVTYNGAPLYFYKDDHNAGDTTGQGIGGVWYVAKP
jgi:predicted lipoprotein with Yx(FWY)xxD motif